MIISEFFKSNFQDDHSYPFLLPKSYENVKVPRVFKSPNISEQVNVQVGEFKKKLRF